MELSVPLPSSPTLLSSNDQDTHIEIKSNLPSPDPSKPSVSPSSPPATILQAEPIQENSNQISGNPLDDIISALLPAFSNEENFDQLFNTLSSFVSDPQTNTPNVAKLLALSSVRKQRKSSESHLPNQPGPSIPSERAINDAKVETEALHAKEIEKLKSEVNQLQSKVKVEEEKRSKSISLLRAVRQKLVQTEKDKTILETNFNEFQSGSDQKLNELKNEKLRLEEELSKSRIGQEQQLSKMRHSFDREIQSIRTQFERETSTKKSQYELDAITVKAAHERETAARNTKISQLESRLREMSTERDNLFERIQSQQAEIETATTRYDEIQGKAGELQHQLSDAHDRLTTLLEEVENLRQISSTQGKGEDGHRRLLSELQSQHLSQTTTLNARISQLEKERTDLEHELGETLKQRLKDIELMRSEAHIKSLEYADSLQNMAERNEQILKSAAQIKTLQDQISAAERSKANQNDSIIQLTKELQKIKLESSTQASQIESLEKALKESQERESSIRSQAQSLKDELRKVQSGVLSNENLRSKGVGYFANFSNTDSTSSPLSNPSKESTSNRSSQSPLRGSHDSTQPDLPSATHDEAELNFEYLRNTLLQFLEHKEMRILIHTSLI
ncbi:hypothetical protein DFH28DRAFT_930307 [Melampsora americana]|nr:hypothetical protein DFH28DRAFT_930307 [Melampsora americana]